MITQNGVGITALLNGETVKQALDPANETVGRGIYVATTLSTVDADLATANIRSGITMFGFAGDADVHDISDATAIEAEVIAGETFYAVGGGIRTGTMPIVALAPGSNAYPAGYHVGAANLTAVDGDLVTANIKNGIIIFNVTGHVDVRNVSDANALVGEVMNGRTFYAVGGARKTGTLATRTLNPANEIVQAGYYAATTLSAVDAQLAAANILSGVNIFGFVGVATVQDIADANALVGEVLNPRTFYSVTGARKTGTMATVTLAADNNAYPAGYHAGAPNLAAIDASLAAANIRSGVNIFGYIGAVTVQEIGAANAILSDVKNGRTFFSVTGGIKTGNLATVALAAGANAYPAGYHVGAASLTAVDGDLVAGNIADGVTIFGVLGTFVGGGLVEDITGEGVCTLLSTTGGSKKHYNHLAGTDYVLASTTDAFAADSLAVGVAGVTMYVLFGDRYKLQLLMGGVLVAESAFMQAGWCKNYVAIGTKALSGAQTCISQVHNYGATAYVDFAGTNDNDFHSGLIGVGSIKLA